MGKGKINANTGQIKELGDALHKAAEVGLRRVVERGEQIVREEVPKVTHNLEHGVSSDIEIPRTGLLRGNIIVSARAGRRGPRTGTLHLPSGKTKTVSLRGQPAFDYAEVVATGRATLRPKNAKALLIPVGSVATLNGKPQPYIESQGQKYIVRPEAKATKPSRYDEESAKRIEKEAPAIFDRALSDVAKGK